MAYLTGIIIVGIVMCVPITAIITDYKRKTMRFKADMVREEIELEKAEATEFHHRN